MPTNGDVPRTPPAWSVIGLISSSIIFIALVILTNFSPFVGNIVGITYACFITIICMLVVFSTYWQRSLPPGEAANNSWPLRTLNWLGLATGSRSGSGRSEMSEGTRERLRIAAGGVLRPRVSRSVGSRDTVSTLPPYSPRRPERTLSTGGVGGHGGDDPGAFLPPSHEFVLDERDEDLWANRPPTRRAEENLTVVYA